MIRKEPRKLFIKTYKVVVFQYAIDFLQQLSESAFVLCPDFNKVLRRGCTIVFLAELKEKPVGFLPSFTITSRYSSDLFFCAWGKPMCRKGNEETSKSFSYLKVSSAHVQSSIETYSKVSIISTGRSRLLEFEIEIVLVV